MAGAKDESQIAAAVLGRGLAKEVGEVVDADEQGAGFEGQADEELIELVVLHRKVHAPAMGFPARGDGHKAALLDAEMGDDLFVGGTEIETEFPVYKEISIQITIDIYDQPGRIVDPESG